MKTNLNFYDLYNDPEFIQWIWVAKGASEAAAEALLSPCTWVQPQLQPHTTSNSTSQQYGNAAMLGLQIIAIQQIENN